MNGYKTYLAAAALATFGVLAQVDWIKFLDHPDSGAYVAIGSAILMAVMRAITQATTVKQALDTPPPSPPKKGK